MKALERPAKGLRLALVLGFGGILAVFLFAALDAIYLVREMRADNATLRQSSLERSRGLETIRSYIVLSHSYVGDHLLDEDNKNSADEMAELRAAWNSTQAALANYPSSTLQERLLLDQLQELLSAHWQRVIRLMSSPRDQRIALGAAFYGQEVVPLRTAVLQIAARVQDADARQLASTEEQIQQEFEALAQRLGLVLNIALGAALVLALGCVLYILRVEGQNQRRYAETVDLSGRLRDVQEEERRVLSRELHDEVGQTLSAVLVDAANLARHIPADNATAQEYLENIRSHASASVNSIRDISLLLRPSMLDDLGLVAALEWQAREVSRRGGVKVRVVAESVPQSLDSIQGDPVRTCIYRLVQEALHNVSSHAGAQHAVVTVRGVNRSIELTVEDDGAGFDAVRTRGLGLLGMEERVKHLGGRLSIESHQGKGTTVHATLPTE
jgi:signal transduction histidine kinase